MSEIERIQQYIQRTKLPLEAEDRYQLTCGEILALHQEWLEDPFHTLFTVYNYGRAKGFRAAQRRAGK